MKSENLRHKNFHFSIWISGKLKGMYSLMGKCIERLDSFFAKASNGTGLIDTKEVMTGFTIDVIASSAFATETNANGDRAKQNPFVHHGLNLFNSNPVKVMTVQTMPRRLLTAMGITSFFPDDSLQFFVDLTSKIVEQRMANPLKKRNDLIQLMVDSFTYEEDLKSNNYDTLTASI